MNGFNFPKMFKGNGVDIISGKENVIKDLTLLLNSELFEFTDDPGYGSNLPLLRYRPDTPLNRDLIIDAIYDVQMFCPNVRFQRSHITVKKEKPGVLEIAVPLRIDNQNYITDVVLYVEAQG